MEWVETAAKTVAEAKEAALDQLGVDDSDAEFQVVEEPKPGLFGRVRGEARVRARVAPRPQRPKQERRTRSGRGSQPSIGGSGATGTASEAPPEPLAAGAEVSGGSPGRSGGGRGRTRARGVTQGGNARDGGGQHQDRESSMDELVTVDAQAAIMEAFLTGLLAAFQLAATVTRTQIDDETIELHVQGGDLGLLIGPKGQTLAAIQDLSRTVLQRRATGTYEGRVRIDVSGYRQRRREALERFAHSVADQVHESGHSKALEPMNAADRKVVHDTINGRDGVRTLSEGEEPRRRVVIEPENG